MLQTIKMGDKGNCVAVAHYLSKYIAGGESAGVFLTDFEEYIRTWQKVHDLTADGIIGEDTWRALANAAPTCSTSKNTKSQATRAVQLLLDGASLKADGVFGKRTKNAVAAFQASAGLKADGVCGPKTWAALIVGNAAADADATPESSAMTTHATGTFKQPVNYKQHDSRWGKKTYSNHGNANQSMANSGCGPTAMANIIATLINPKVTPWDMAQLALKWGDRTASSGTATSFFKHIQAHYGFVKMIGTGSLATLKACLDAGGYVVCRMGKGYWTNGGHYITAWKYDDKYIYCNDPSSPTSKRAERKKQEQSDFLKERKDFWCFFPERKAA